MERLAPFLSEDLFSQLVNMGRHRRLEAELRPVAVQFIHLVGLEALALDQGADVATRVFQVYFTRLQSIVRQHHGVISQLDAYNLGFFFVNTFGAPKAYEGISLCAIASALQITQVLEDLNQEFALDPPLQQRFGMTYDLIFNGEIGAKYRREAVIAGPAVNRSGAFNESGSTRPD